MQKQPDEIGAIRVSAADVEQSLLYAADMNSGGFEMSASVGKKKIPWKLVLMNACRFTFNVLFAYVFQVVFGPENILAGVAICVGLTTLPDLDPGIRPVPMAAIIMVLYVGAGAVAQLALAPWGIAFIADVLFVGVILLLSSEPIVLKTSISFLLCFVFCQANPVPATGFGIRLLSLAAGGAIVAAVTVLCWKRKKTGEGGRTMKEQIALCAQNRGYILRASFGIGTAMLVGMVAPLERPMWISIVVMSLTQVQLSETKQRILYRSAATIIGAVIFSVVLVQVIPREYAMVFILLIGYISFFTKEYKYTQIVNAICALNASLLVLTPENAVINRVMCLGCGIVVVVIMWGLQYLFRYCRKNIYLLREAG